MMLHKYQLLTYRTIRFKQIKILCKTYKIVEVPGIKATPEKHHLKKPNIKPSQAFNVE